MRRIDRFDEYMAHANLNDNKVTVLLGLSNGVIGKSRKERRDLSDRVVEQIEKFFPDLNPDWLKYGEGRVYRHPAGDGYSLFHIREYSQKDSPPASSRRGRAPMNKTEL